MWRHRESWMILTLIAASGLGIPSRGFAQAAKKPVSKTDTKPPQTPQQQFVSYFTAGTPINVGLASPATGAGDQTSLFRSGASFGSIAGSESTEASKKGSGSKAKKSDLTPREQRLIKREDQLLSRQVTLIDRLDRLVAKSKSADSLQTRSTNRLRVLATTPTSPQIQAAENNVVAQLSINQKAIDRGLSTLAKLTANGPPDAQAAFAQLQSQATTVSMEAIQAITSSGRAVGEQFPATASK